MAGPVIHTDAADHLEEPPVSASALAERSPLNEVRRARGADTTGRDEFHPAREALPEIVGMPPLEIGGIPHCQRYRPRGLIAVEPVSVCEEAETPLVETRGLAWQ